jgi:hypothetical protein
MIQRINFAVRVVVVSLSFAFHGEVENASPVDQLVAGCRELAEELGKEIVAELVN